MIKFTIDFDNNLFVTANNRHICVLAEECDTATLGESYDSAEREFFPILAEFALDMLRPNLQYYDGSYTPQAALALTYLIKTNQLKGKLITENGEQIDPRDESSPFEAYPVIKIAGRGYDKHLLCNDDSQYDVVGLSDAVDRIALRQLHRKLYPRIMLGTQSPACLMLFIKPELAVCLRDDSGVFQIGVAYHTAHCEDENQWRYAYTEEVLDLLEV
nr:MAG TPA: hypothetical protein [Caudoviricetes sp.]